MIPVAITMNKSNLYIIAALIWGIPGAIICVKGILAYLQMSPSKLWRLLLITACVLIGFYFMFTRIVDKYAARIAALPTRTSLWQTFPLRGWLMIAFFACLGIALKFIPGIPPEFTASFYSGLGPMLLFAALRFIQNRV